MNNTLIKISDLTKVYDSGNEKVYALDHVNLEISEGEITAILGPSGSGKSTLVNIIGGIDTADNGIVFINGKEITSMKNSELTGYRRDYVGFVFQFYNLISNLTVYENVEVVSDISKSPMNIDELLKVLGIDKLANRYPAELSGGQQQRVAIARAFVKNPKLILCDEPTGALDYKSSLDILKLIKEINQKYGTTILIITHNNSISSMCDRIVRLTGGKITQNIINTDILEPERIEW